MPQFPFIFCLLRSLVGIIRPRPMVDHWTPMPFQFHEGLLAVWIYHQSASIVFVLAIFCLGLAITSSHLRQWSVINFRQIVQFATTISVRRIQMESSNSQFVGQNVNTYLATSASRGGSMKARTPAHIAERRSLLNWQPKDWVWNRKWECFNEGEWCRRHP